MKKKTKKLVLRRETIALLKLREVLGGYQTIATTDGNNGCQSEATGCGTGWTACGTC